MHAWFARLSIRRKISVVVVATCTLVLLAACSALFVVQSVTLEQGITSDLSSVADVLAANSTAAVAFDDPAVAAELLSALHAKPDVLGACLHRKDGSVLAHFGSVVLPHTDHGPPDAPGARVVDTHLWMTKRIALDGAAIGTLHLETNFAETYRTLLRLYRNVLVMVLLGSVLLVIPLSSVFQRAISQPILRLADTARAIAERKDYSVRAGKEADDEIGRFTDTFNAMLVEIQARDAAIEESRERFEAAVTGSSDGIWDWDLARSDAYFSPRWKHILGFGDSEFPNAHEAWTSRIHPDDAERVLATIGHCLDGNAASFEVEYRLAHKNGSYRWVLTRGAALRRGDGVPQRLAGSQTDVTARKQAEEELERLNTRLRDISRQAGMAEVASSVLHNVGNVLNSVIVSSGLAIERLRQSKVENLTRAASILAQHEGDLGQFLAEDAKGKILPQYLVGVSEHLRSERSEILHELNALQQNVEHIKEIVAVQQSYATVAGCTEVVSPADMVEDALRMNAARFVRHGIEVIRDFQPAPRVAVDRHKMLQILVNLLSNAKHAVEASDREDKRVTVTIRAASPDAVTIGVSDNGVGIPAENLLRIFNHGFTTKENGHGFGLHSSANAAQEMGGQLTGESAGPGTGATFTLELPVEGSGATSSLVAGHERQRPGSPQAPTE